MCAKDIAFLPADYVKTAIVAKEAGLEMMARLDWVTLQPQVILDVGCGPGEFSQSLQKRYPKALVLACDLNEAMLAFAKNQHPVVFNADGSQLPLALHSVDLVFANFLLPWQAETTLLLREWRRVLRPNGLLMLTALGPDTLQTMREKLGGFFPKLMDMHEIGDMLLQEGFSDPVLDVDRYLITYKEKEKLFFELLASDMWQPEVDGDWQACADRIDTLKKEKNVFEMFYEIIFAHAFAPLQSTQSVSSDGSVSIPLADLVNQVKARTR